MNLRSYGNPFLTIISETIGTIICLRVARFLKECKVLEFYGKNTLFIMGYTYAVFNVILILGNRFCAFKNVVVSFLIQVMILTVLIWINKRFTLFQKIM